MKIAIEAQRIFRKKKHGMDFVALETIRELQESDLENEYFIFVAPGGDRCLSSSPNMHIIEVSCPTYILWEQVALPMAIRRVRPDLLHCTSNTAPIWCGVPLVLTLHDIIFLEKKQSSNRSFYQNLGRIYRRFVVPRVLPKCKKIITVSQFECNRIRQALNIDPARITAIYNGFNTRFSPGRRCADVVWRYIQTDSYLFFLGNTDPKKNTPGTLKAYSIYFRQSARPLPLLIADLSEKDIEHMLKEEKIEFIRPMLHIPGYILNRNLPAVYCGASVFLYTSFRESFGIPLLEAMACGIPVITSSTSAIPEIAGEGAILTDPSKPEAIAAQLIKLEQDPAYRKEQVSYGLERVKLFSWKKTAGQLLELYKEVYRLQSKN